MEFQNPVMTLSAQHTKRGVVIQFADKTYEIPHARVWDMFSCLRTHILEYGAVDVYGREIDTDDI